MAIAVTMNHNDEKDAHDHDMVMPGFRFHPTEEELIEFYLRRKVEGKRFNVELITFLDLYRYDPWELPALAAIGEKEWFFYVPRDRKYRNGDRPNRVTTSGYWKATGADRMIRTESGRSIGLKKTLVFYSGKAPKGIRTSWIMNEYRLPQHETDRYQKAEISLCRVHKRAGVDDNSISSGTSSSRGSVQFSDKRQQNIVHPSTISLQLLSSSSELEKPHEVATSSTSTTNTWTTLGLENHPLNSTLPPPRVLCEEADQAVTDSRLMCVSPLKRPEFESYCIQKKDDQPDLRHRPKQVECSLFLQNSSTTLFNSPSSSSSSILVPVADDLHKIVNYQQAYTHQQQQQQQQNHHQNASQFLQLPPSHQEHQLVAPIDTVNSPNSLTPLTFQEKLWEWNLIPEANRNYNSTTTTTYHFK